QEFSPGYGTPPLTLESMQDSQEAAMITRRTCLKSIGGGLAALAGAEASETPSTAQTSSKAEPSKLRMPGLYRGRVASVESPEAIISGKYQPQTIQKMM